MSKVDDETLANLLTIVFGLFIEEFSHGKSEWTKERTERFHNQIRDVIETNLDVWHGYTP